MISHIFFIGLLAGALFCAWKISVADLRRRIIPDAYLFPLLLIGLLIVALFPWWHIGPRESALAGSFGYILATIIGLIFSNIKNKGKYKYDNPIGMGDIKLIGVGGIWLGFTGLSIALVLSCLLGGVWGLREKQKFIPFAPFFIAGGFLALIITSFLI